jgi:hypothetical protein
LLKADKIHRVCNGHPQASCGFLPAELKTHAIMATTEHEQEQWWKIIVGLAK